KELTFQYLDPLISDSPVLAEIMWIIEVPAALVAVSSYIRYSIKNEKSYWGLTNKIIGSIGFGGLFLSNLMLWFVKTPEPVVAEIVTLGIAALSGGSELIHKCISLS